MASIVIPGRSTQQPASWVGIDWGNFSPTAAYLGGKWALQGISGGPWTANSGTWSSAGNGIGSGLRFAGSTSSIALLTIPSIANPAGGTFAMGAVFVPTASAGASAPGSTAVSLGATSATTWFGIGQRAGGNAIDAGFYGGPPQISLVGPTYPLG